MAYIVLVFLFLILAISVLALIFSLNVLITIIKVKVPFVVTPGWAIDTIVDRLNLKPGQKVYDLGCGDARFLIAVKNKFPAVSCVGYELAWWPYLKAKRHIKKSGFDITLLRKNFYHEKLSDADFIFCFLIHSVMPRLEKKLLAELKPGAEIYSYGFKFPNWQPKEIITNPKKPKGSKINIYIK